MGQNDSRWHVFRQRGTHFEMIAEFEGPTAERAIERAVEHEIRRLPVAGCSGSYFAVPADSMVRRDWHVSYDKRDSSDWSMRQ